MAELSSAGSVGGALPADPKAVVSLGCRVLGAEEQSDLVWGHLSRRGPGRRGVWM